MKKRKYFWLKSVGILVLSAVLVLGWKYSKIGDPVDEMNGVVVYDNGYISNVSGRNTTEDGYNLGLKYQCVEFVKRYYYEVYKHKMPNSYGNALDFFDASVKDGEMNKDRNLTQYTNGSVSKPKTGDLIIFDGHFGNAFGHVAIISKVNALSIEVIQQNTQRSRGTFPMKVENDKYHIKESLVLGWLRKN